jgi:U3 small nucleolar ribonucleoprotein protein IMP3
MRTLKPHEQKLLKKVDFLQWKGEHQHREVATMRRYHLQDRDDYKKYNALCGHVTRLTSLLKRMDARDPVRVELTEALLQKLHAVGAVPTQKSLALCDRLTTSSFCRRRLAVVMVRLKMAETVREAATFIEQGHVRVGPETVSDPAFLVTRSSEDFVTWVDTSKIKRKVMKYNDKLDDFELLNA